MSHRLKGNLECNNNIHQFKMFAIKNDIVRVGNSKTEDNLDFFIQIFSIKKFLVNVTL